MMMMPNTVSFTSTLLAVFVTGAALLGGGSQYQVSAQLDAAPTQTASYPLSTTSATHCDTIVDNSVFSGTCCALNVTTGNGCVLNVAGGNCVIKGQWWTIDFTSTGDDECPPGEYTNADLGLPDPPTEAPLADIDGAFDVHNGILSSTATLLAASLFGVALFGL